MNKFPVDC